jgi:hypothetical protein
MTAPNPHSNDVIKTGEVYVRDISCSFMLARKKQVATKSFQGHVVQRRTYCDPIKGQVK